MRRPKLVASAKPNDHKVWVKRKTFVFAHIRKKEMGYGQSVVHMLRWAAKETLKRVKEIVKSKN